MGCELISLRGRTDTYGGCGQMFEWVWADACERCGLMLGREGDLIPWMRSGQIPMGDMGECLSGCGRMPLGEGVRSFDLGSLYL